jgi:hypothetical protein
MDTACMWARKTSVTGNGNKNTDIQKSIVIVKVKVK